VETRKEAGACGGDVDVDVKGLFDVLGLSLSPFEGRGKGWV
jgi:hypothetical protein